MRIRAIPNVAILPTLTLMTVLCGCNHGGPPGGGQALPRHKPDARKAGISMADTLVLEGENMSPVESPVWTDIEARLRKLGPSGSGFLTLSHPRVGYVQAAGSSRQMVVEFRMVTN